MSYPEGIIVAMIGQPQIVVFDCPVPRVQTTFHGELLSMAALARDPPGRSGGELPGR
jgi:hypothetical protein